MSETPLKIKEIIAFNQREDNLFNKGTLKGGLSGSKRKMI